MRGGLHEQEINVRASGVEGFEARLVGITH